MKESRRAMQGSVQGAGMGGGSAPGGSGGGAVPGGAQGARLEQARQDWIKRAPLAPRPQPADRHLDAARRADIGVERSVRVARAMMKDGLCEVLFSSNGIFEFRPGALVGIDKRTRRADVLDQLEYLGDAKRVVVIPKASLKLMVFDVQSPNRIQWADQNCTLVRVGAPAQTTHR